MEAGVEWRRGRCDWEETPGSICLTLVKVKVSTLGWSTCGGFFPGWQPEFEAQTMLPDFESSSCGKHRNEYYDYYVMRFVTYMHSVERYTLFPIQQRVLICSHAKVDKFQALDAILVNQLSRSRSEVVDDEKIYFAFWNQLNLLDLDCFWDRVVNVWTSTSISTSSSSKQICITSKPPHGNRSEGYKLRRNAQMKLNFMVQMLVREDEIDGKFSGQGGRCRRTGFHKLDQYLWWIDGGSHLLPCLGEGTVAGCGISRDLCRAGPAKGSSGAGCVSVGRSGEEAISHLTKYGFYGVAEIARIAKSKID
ncbi:hypothetical protein LXL04_008613 [Taraxacum kok-saghyz]